MARDAGQQGDRAQRLATRGEARHTFAQPNERGLRLAVHRGHGLDVLDLEAGDLRHALGRELRQDVALDLVEAQRLLRDVAAVGEAVAHQDVHDAERKRGIGTDPDRQIEIGGLRAARAARVDDDGPSCRAASCLPRRAPRNARWSRQGRRPRRSPDRNAPPTADRRCRRALPSRPTPPRSRCRTRCRPAAARSPAHGRGRSRGRGSSGPDGRSRRSPAGRAGHSPR